MERQANPYCALYRLTVDDGEGSWKAQTDRAGLRIRFAAKFRGATTEHLRFGVEFDVNF